MRITYTVRSHLIGEEMAEGSCEAGQPHVPQVGLGPSRADGRTAGSAAEDRCEEGRQEEDHVGEGVHGS